MLSDFIKNKFLEHFSHTPTQDQELIFAQLSEFINSPSEVFILKGYAGTGKTSLLSSLTHTLEEMKIPVVLMAPTGRAAKVLSQYTQKPAYTIHKTIYKQVSQGDSQRFNLFFNTLSRAIFIIDEASMLANSSGERSIFGSGNLIDDLFSYIFGTPKDCKIILVGDDAQLPPVGLSESPALQQEFIEQSYLRTTVLHSLENVVRQNKHSMILETATRIRSLLQENTLTYPQIYPAEDVERITGDILIEKIESSYDAVGTEHTIIITRSNKYANIYNKGIRSMVLWRDSRISVGDYVMIVKNNYFWTETLKTIDFIANGDIAEIVSIQNYEELYNFSFATVTLRFPDYNNEEIDAKVLLDTLDSESPALPFEDNKRFFETVQEDYVDIKNKRTRYQEMKKNPYFNALQIKFAYAVTCHKAQGGQWKHVYVDHGYMPEDSLSHDFLRWLYTACTRATEKLFLVNFKKEFFEQE
ncbi:MAG: AAA family ATPase [Bacteroidales bacterium]|jgi:exodeoxyribonuclease-5|nr:AAA family ATPase [Bacteroidales bacterium]